MQMHIAAIALGLLTCACALAQPTLWFSKEDLPRLQGRTAEEPLATAWEQIHQRAEAFCTPGGREYVDPEKVDDPPGAQWRVQVRGHFYGGRLTTWMETLGFAYQLTGDARFGAHGAALLEAAARKLPVSHPDIAPGFAGARGDIMRGLAVGRDWLGEAMTPEQKAAWAETAAGYVRNMTEEVAREERVWWRPYHNFMGVATGAAGMLALTLRESHPEEAERWVALCAETVERWLDSGFDARGAYVEGTGYGVYGLSNAVRFADALRRAGGKDLFAHPHLRRVPHFYAMSLLPGERVFDARNNANYAGFGDPTMLRLAGMHDNGLARWLWDHAGGGTSPFRIIWDNDVAPLDPPAAGVPLAEHFEGRGLCIWRTGWEAGDVMFSIEAGPYYPTTHNQADEGHFTLYGLGQRWGIDSGYGNTGLPGGRDQTVAHSCVLINGEGMARSGSGRGTSGELVEYHNDDVYGYALADATEAYNRNHGGEPGAGVEHARRHALFIRPSAGAPAYAVVLDDIRKDDEAHEYTWMLHTPGDMRIETDADGATLTPGSAFPVTLVETPDDAEGQGHCVWTFEVAEAGEYVIWARVRAAGEVTGQSDSFFVQVNDGPRIDWHMPSRRDWTWGKVARGVPQEPVSFELEPGTHTLRFSTRETGAQLERVVITADAALGPPFILDHEGITLLPQDAVITAPMRVVREEGDAGAPRMRLLLSAAGAVRYEVDEYDGHLRLKAHLTTVQPEFAAVLLPLPAGVGEPEVRMTREEGEMRTELRWPGRRDVITWPGEGERRPVVGQD